MNRRNYPIHRKQRKLYKERNRKALSGKKEWKSLLLAKIPLKKGIL